MTGEPEPISIDLAREAPFELGALQVRPSTREVANGERTHVLEPRVMQVLVALNRRRRAVVSREDLFATCWGGRTVGEESINRCIGAIRRLSETHGGFEVTTVARVGYRLSLAETANQAGTEPLLAVLAFDNLSADPEMQFFSDGVSEEILDTVARGTTVKVIAPSSSFQFRGAEKAAARVASALKVTHLLDGSVRRAGPRVRIAAHLVDCASETTIWSDRFERELDNVFALQDEIARAVAGALRAALALAPRPAVIRPETYEAYLYAQQLVERKQTYGDPAAIPLLEQVVADAPTFAAAWELLAATRAMLLRSRGAAEPYAKARAAVVQAAETALQLDPGRGRAHTVLALLEPWAAYARRETLLDQALAASANDLWVTVSRGVHLIAVGRANAALNEAQRAVTLDPLAPAGKLTIAVALALLGRRRECLEFYDKCVGEFPSTYFDGPLFASAIAGDWARHDAYLAMLPPGQAITPGPYEADLRRLFTNLRTPDRAAMLEVAAEARAAIRETGTVPLNAFVELDAYGLRDEAYELVEAASFDHMFRPDGPRPVTWFGPHIIFRRYGDEGLPADPRFPRLCAKLGLVNYWLETDHWPDCADDGVLPYDFKAECRRLAAPPAPRQ
jgi:TolB-like protein